MTVQASWSRSDNTTSAPSFANRVHSASPMPLAPPVTTATLPLTFIAGPFVDGSAFRKARFAHPPPLRAREHPWSIPGQLANNLIRSPRRSCCGTVVAGNNTVAGRTLRLTRDERPHSTTGLDLLGDRAVSGLPSAPTVPATAGTSPACRSRTCSRRRPGSQSPIEDRPLSVQNVKSASGWWARVASAYVTAVRTTGASRCRRIAWNEVAGSTPRL
jgi:hypothetical protein